MNSDFNQLPSSVRKLQLGASRLETLDKRVLATFLDKTWMHLGDHPHPPKHLSKIIEEYTLGQLCNILLNVVTRRATRPRSTDIGSDTLYAMTSFIPWEFKKGDCLPIPDRSIDFIFSEHFFEHLLFPDAVALFRECSRVLKPGGIIRTVVPDADLRTYAKPESVGFPNRRLSFSHPNKHRTRWSVYLLAEILELTGFRAIPLRYCDINGTYFCRMPADIEDEYGGCLEWSTVRTLEYVVRVDSLIVDGRLNPK